MKTQTGDAVEQEADRLEFDAPPAPTFASIGAKIGAKNLLIVIVTMPFVFVAVVTAIIAVFGSPDDDRTAAAPQAARAATTVSIDDPAAATRRAVLPIPASAANAPAAIVLPAGAEAGAISLDGDRLAVRVRAEAGEMIVIYDLAKDAIVKTVPLVAAGASAMSVAPAPLDDETAGGGDVENEFQQDARNGVPSPRLAAHRASEN